MSKKRRSIPDEFDFEEMDDIQLEHQPPRLPNPLFDTYGILPGLPLRDKVESLLLGYSLEADEIADLVSTEDKTYSVAHIQSVIDSLNEEWKRLGSNKAVEEKEIARGKLIAQLRRLLRDCDEILAASVVSGKGKDPRMLAQKASIMDKLSKLEKLDEDEKKDDDSSSGPKLTEKIAGFGSKRLKELHTRIKEAKARAQT